MKIELRQGDITNQPDIDAIVNAANTDLWLGSGVAGAIARRGGPEIEREAVALGPIPLGEAVRTTAGKLPNKYVIHAAAMGYRQEDRAVPKRAGSASSEAIIHDAAYNSLTIADKSGCKSIAFPALATGVGGFPLDECARVMMKKLADKYGWKIGDVIELKGAIWPVDPRLTLRGIYTGLQEGSFFFHREYVEEAMGRPGLVGTYRVRLDSPDSAPRVMDEIDRMFKSSTAPTKTETEAAFAAAFVSMLGNVKGLIAGVGLVVVFAITLIGANTMAMSARERFTEVAVMKALGFRPGLILALLLSESVLIALVGGVLAAVGAMIFFQFVGMGDMLAIFLQNFKINANTIAIALGVSALIGLVSGGIPAWNAARIKIVDGLRRVA